MGTKVSKSPATSSSEPEFGGRQGTAPVASEDSRNSADISRRSTSSPIHQDVTSHPRSEEQLIPNPGRGTLSRLSRSFRGLGERLRLPEVTEGRASSLPSQLSDQNKGRCPFYCSAALSQGSKFRGPFNLFGGHNADQCI